GKIMAPVALVGPASGDTIATNGAVFSCSKVENATGYQLIFGSDPNRVMDFTIVSDTTNPATATVSTLPYLHTWWTVRAYDQFGSTIYADPQLINLPANRPPVADAGADQIVYAGLDGMATVTISAANSTDPDGNKLNYAWAWTVDGNAYLSNGLSLTIQLPVG